MSTSAWHTAKCRQDNRRTYGCTCGLYGRSEGTVITPMDIDPYDYSWDGRRAFKVIPEPDYRIYRALGGR